MKTRSFIIAALFVTACLSACGGQNDQNDTDNSVLSESGSAEATRPQEVSSSIPTELAPHKEAIVVADPSAPSSRPSMYDDPGSPVPPSSEATGIPTPASAPASAPTSAPSSAPQAFTASVTVESQFDQRLGLVHISWSVQGSNLSELYLYSDGFNRLNTDGSAEDPCGVIEDTLHSHNGKRRLLVNSTSTGANLGEDLNEGSPAHLAVSSYLEGAEECTDSNCHGYAPSQVIDGKRPAATTPVCRIDLKDTNGAFVSHGSFYSRVLVKDAVFHLYAKNSDGSETSSESKPVEAPQAIIENISAAPTASGMTFTVDYLYGIRPASVAPAGCTIDTDQSQFQDVQKGRGHLVASCPLTQGNVRFTAYGIGSGNTDSRPLEIALGTPVIEKPTDFGNHECDNGSLVFEHCKGRFTIQSKAYRSVTITDLTKHTTVAQGHTGLGISSLTLVSDGGELRHVRLTWVDSDGKPTFVFKKVPHDYQNTSWHVEAVVDGATISSTSLDKPYAPSFQILGNYGPTLNLSGYDVCDNGMGGGIEGHCGYCIDSQDAQIATSLSWQGRHVSRIDVNCNHGDMDIGNPGVTQNYEIQIGPVTAVLNAGNRDNWDDGYACTVTAYDYRGNPVGTPGSLSAFINCHSDNHADQNFQPDGTADPDSENNGTGYKCPMLNGTPLPGCQS